MLYMPDERMGQRFSIQVAQTFTKRARVSKWQLPVGETSGGERHSPDQQTEWPASRPSWSTRHTSEPDALSQLCRLAARTDGIQITCAHSVGFRQAQAYCEVRWVREQNSPLAVNPFVPLDGALSRVSFEVGHDVTQPQNLKAPTNGSRTAKLEVLGPSRQAYPIGAALGI